MYLFIGNTGRLKLLEVGDMVDVVAVAVAVVVPPPPPPPPPPSCVSSSNSIPMGSVLSPPPDSTGRAGSPTHGLLYRYSIASFRFVKDLNSACAY